MLLKENQTSILFFSLSLSFFFLFLSLCLSQFVTLACLCPSLSNKLPERRTELINTQGLGLCAKLTADLNSAAQRWIGAVVIIVLTVHCERPRSLHPAVLQHYGTQPTVEFINSRKSATPSYMFENECGRKCFCDVEQQWRHVLKKVNLVLMSLTFFNVEKVQPNYGRYL